MIEKDFLIDTKKKKITHNPKGTKKIYTLNELYSYLQDLFDEADKMEYEIPILADSEKKYMLINDWSINKTSLKYLKDGTLLTE